MRGVPRGGWWPVCSTSGCIFQYLGCWTVRQVVGTSSRRASKVDESRSLRARRRARHYMHTSNLDRLQPDSGLWKSPDRGRLACVPFHHPIAKMLIDKFVILHGVHLVGVVPPSQRALSHCVAWDARVRPDGSVESAAWNQQQSTRFRALAAPNLAHNPISRG